jgi:hypothetical protein
LTTEPTESFIKIIPITAINSLKQGELSFYEQKTVESIAIIAGLVGSLSLYQRIRDTLLERLGEFRLWG